MRVLSLTSVVLILAAANVATADLSIDFNDNDGGVSPTQSGFTSVTQTGATNIVSDVGTIDISFSSFSIGDPDRDRGALTGGPGLSNSNLLRDFIFSQAGQFDITVSGLLAGNYDFTGYFHDNNVDQGTLDFFVNNGDGNGFVQVLNDVDYSGPTTSPDPVGMGMFSFSADGTNDVIFRMDSSGVNDVINGFQISAAAVPEPTSIAMWLVLGALGGILGRKVVSRRK